MISVLLGTGYFNQTTKTLVLIRESLDMICNPSIDEEQVAEFETVITDVI